MQNESAKIKAPWMVTRSLIKASVKLILIAGVDGRKGLHEIYGQRRAIPAREEDKRGSDPSILARIAYFVV